jgi:lipopolysaccharide biosynthesis glycosyltransferase
MTRPIIFAIDKNYIQHLAVALESLFKNNDFIINVYVLFDGLNKNDIYNLDIIAKRYQQSITYHKVNIERFSGFKENFHFTKAMYFRLLIPDILDADVQSAIYIDSDVVINGNIKYLFELDLEDNKLAAVGNPDFSAIERLKLKINTIYFDSGLLVFNLDIWRKENIHKKIIKYIKNNPEKLLYPDNDALNIIIDGDFLEISPRFSLQSNYIDCKICDFTYFEKFESLQEIFQNPVVIQYAGSSKPWHYLSNDHYRKLYWKYLKDTPYKNFTFEDKTLKNVIKKYMLNPFKKIIEIIKP